MGISVAIIAKNEEEVIGRCLECALQFSDEVVLVDTGSTDRTVEVASGFGPVRVQSSELFDKDTDISDFEFGVAKNEAIRKCTEDWVVWLDADDFVDEENARRIKSLGATPGDRLMEFTVAYGNLRFTHTRMLPNGKGVLFDETHACHEFLLTNGLPVERVDVTVQHLPGKRHVLSLVRNLAILEKDYNERGRRDTRTVFYLANTYRECGRREEAVAKYDEYLLRSEWPEERFFARYYKAQALDRLDRRAEARKELFLAMAEDMRFAEPLCMLGDMAMGDGESGRAELWFRMATLTPFPVGSRLFVAEGMYGDYPRRRLRDVERLRVKEEVPEKADEPAPKAPDAPRRRKTYALPRDRSMAFLAVAALASCSRGDDCSVFEVVPADAWQAELVRAVSGIGEGEGGARPLSVPEDRHGRHVVEWFCRSAGYVGVPWGPPEMVAEKQPGAGVVAFCFDGWGSGEWDRLIELSGRKINMVRSCESVRAAVELVSRADEVLCGSGWLQHLAAALGVPATVVWTNGAVPAEEGWGAAQMAVAGDTSPEAVAAVLNRRARDAG